MSGLAKYEMGMDLAHVGRVLAASRYFGVTEEQAITQVMMGAELGLSPVASLTGIHVVQGRPEVGAHLIAGAIARHPHYDYQVVEHTPERCVIEFYRDGEERGQNSFSMEDAKRAGLATKGVWRSHPKAMLFARAISQGYRYHCPDVFSCPVYVDGEISGPARTIEVTAVPPSSAAIVTAPAPAALEAPAFEAPALEAAVIDIAIVEPDDVPPELAAAPRLRTLDDVDERFPELGPGYRLEATDYQARVHMGAGKVEDCIGMTLEDAHAWQWAAETRGREVWKQLDDRQRALVLRAHSLRSKRKKAEIDERAGLAAQLLPDCDDQRRRALCRELGIAQRRTAEAHTAEELRQLLELAAAPPAAAPKASKRKHRNHDREAQQCADAVSEALHDQAPENRRGWMARLVEAAKEDASLLPVSADPAELLGPWLDNLPALRLYVAELEGRRIEANNA